MPSKVGFGRCLTVHSRTGVDDCVLKGRAAGGFQSCSCVGRVVTAHRLPVRSNQSVGGVSPAGQAVRVMTGYAACLDAPSRLHALFGLDAEVRSAHSNDLDDVTAAFEQPFCLLRPVHRAFC